MPSSSLSKSKVVQSFKENRFEFAAVLRMSFDKFVKQCGYKRIQINSRTIAIAVTSLADSLDRYSAYHNDLDPSPYKIAGFLMYWVAKTKPIYLEQGCNLGWNGQDDSEFLIDRYDSVNEMFAFCLGINYLDVELDSIPDETILDFIYLLYFRETNPKHLILTLELLHKSICHH